MGLFGGGGFFKKIFKGVGKGINEVFNPKSSLNKGLMQAGLNLVTMGGYAQQQATKEAQKARNQAQAQYQQQIAAAKAEANRIAKLEEERKRKLLLYGTQNPSTMIGGYLGIGGSANVSKPSLG